MSEFLLECRAVLAKELLQLWRARARLVATGTFALATLLLFSFAGGLNEEALRENSAGYLWIGILLASTLALGEGLRVETEHNAIEMLLLLPVRPAAIFYGKAVGNLLVLLIVGIVMLPFLTALFDATPTEGVGKLVLCVLAGSASISAPGTMHATLAARARSRDVLLPLLLFPLVIPCVVAAVQATHLVYAGDPMNQLGSWLGVLLAFCVVHWSVGGLLYSRVVED